MKLGVGAGWMAPEFRALGVERSRGALADAPAFEAVAERLARLA